MKKNTDSPEMMKKYPEVCSGEPKIEGATWLTKKAFSQKIAVDAPTVKPV